MDGWGCARNNIFTERLWCTVKYEDVYLHEYTGPKEVFSQPSAIHLLLLLRKSTSGAGLPDACTGLWRELACGTLNLTGRACRNLNKSVHIKLTHFLL
jgi:hypothetical protein